MWFASHTHSNGLIYAHLKEITPSMALYIHSIEGHHMRVVINRLSMDHSKINAARMRYIEKRIIDTFAYTGPFHMSEIETP